MKRDEFLTLKQNLFEQGMIPLRIVSDSMEPLLITGANYKVATLKSRPKKFDIVVFYRDGKIVAHYVWRVNELNGLSFTTRSLQNPDKDEIPVEESDILGILVGKRLNFIKKLILSFRYA